MMDPRELLQESVVINTHLDLLYDVLQKRRQGQRRVIAEQYLSDWRAGGVNCIVSSIYCDEGSNFLREGLMQINALQEELAESEGVIVLATTAVGIRRAARANQVAIMLAFEGSEPLEGEWQLLRLFHSLGVRILGLAWSRPNWAADGSRFADAAYEGYGLTEDGKKLVRLADELQMIIDISHLNERGFWDVMQLTDKPLLASHSCCRALSDMTRNLDDKQIKAMAQRGSVIALNGVNVIANSKNPDAASVQDLVQHVRHLQEVGGISCVGVGLDQCDKLISAAPLDFQSSMFDIIPRHADLLQLVLAMQDAGFADADIAAVLGGNTLKLIESVIGL